MKKSVLLLIIIFFSCNKSENCTLEIKNKKSEKGSVKLEKGPLIGNFCFLKTIDKDSTIIQLNIVDKDNIKGVMIWNPWERDGAIGTLSGKINTKDEMEMLYNYTIEGNDQTEKIIMKIERNLLFIKIGELIDPNSNGNLSYKNVLEAKYTESLRLTKCFEY